MNDTTPRSSAVADKILELLDARDGWEEDSSSPLRGHFKKAGCALSFTCGNFWLSEPEKYFVGNSLAPLKFDEEDARRIRLKFNSLLMHLQKVQREKDCLDSAAAMENAFAVLCNPVAESPSWVDMRSGRHPDWEDLDGLTKGVVLMAEDAARTCRHVVTNDEYAKAQLSRTDPPWRWWIKWTQKEDSVAAAWADLLPKPPEP